MSGHSQKPHTNLDRNLKRPPLTNVLGILLIVAGITVEFPKMILGSDLPPTTSFKVDDTLPLTEEDFVYNTKTPTQRVAAFMKIADRKMEEARQLQKKNPGSDFLVPLQGYIQAFQGAWTGVSWGQSRGENMRRSIETIEKTARRHQTVLYKLQAGASSDQKQAIVQIQNLLSARQKL